MTVELKYVGPFDEVEIAATGQLCAAGGTVEVSAEIAGRAPSGDPDSDDFDPGEGLLAQPSNWVTASDEPTSDNSTSRKKKRGDNDGSDA